MDNSVFFKSLEDLVLGLGAYRASVIPVTAVETDESFRRLCEQNVCGNYGKNWACPPDAGGIIELIEQLRSYEFMLVYQLVGELEDSYDFEGMADAAKRFAGIINRMRVLCKDEPFSRYICLGAGGCTVCEVCAKRTGEPCRHPDLMTTSLETYGVNVSKLAPAAGMKYINGQNTVTYFGAVLFDL
ncbi:MAG: DUF2284 domain-containing protein [Clostridia bacterium]|nr:DUF2284 domain-containing protein [Clostridia bacterium]